MPETRLPNRPIGYARISTYGQTLDAQLEQLRKAGCTKVCREKATGARADRRELLKMARVHGRSIFGQNLERFVNRVGFGREPATRQPNAASDPLQNSVAFAILWQQLCATGNCLISHIA